MKIDFVELIDILGTAAFAVSGASMAKQKMLDAFGVMVIAFVTAIGGGTLRDLLTGQQPVGWLSNETAISVIITSALLTLLFGRYVKQIPRTLFIFDTLGLALFAIVGFEKGLALHFSPLICMALGTITACFGGVIRDVLLNQVPLIFRKEIYASACIGGGIIYFVLHQLKVEAHITQLICAASIVGIRILAVRYHLSLPTFNKK